MNLWALKGSLKLYDRLDAHTWFRVGGPCLGVFSPLNIHDLCQFIRQVSKPYRILGAGSNVLVHDEGWPGFVIKLQKGFHSITVENHRIRVQAGALDRVVAQTAQKAGLSGLEFLYTIPGTIGGALALNAGCYGHEISNVLEEVTVMSPSGELHVLSPKELGYEYRRCALPFGWIFIEAVLSCTPSDPSKILELMRRYVQQRQNSQPLQVRTGGSTFKNPPGSFAWKWIDAVGARGERLGDAQCSSTHCNFLINLGNATAQDLWALGSQIQTRVRLAHQVNLEWEIHIWDETLFFQSQQEQYAALASY
ncbi:MULTISPECIES: UDP-N-acetylmuramate dehydrogenase [Holospora]|uniref:UDP-N-acetylenolpyruvoylglucosamine reductase n=2 Tax=Holospora TaxID=44747 RepID=A0A061JFW5_9PROT|nr:MULTISPECIES: UDP-N-acetylmuramate dehydrogenase [Holospora]ETZ04600.1 UDP-N-acetylenolpyruvoylglucosamine reductase [Holospora undulata HU1]GAJ45871.1 UDP-N-acetylenolpyruvoylglucosamine reductase [Holospora elegans E1]